MRTAMNTSTYLLLYFLYGYLINLSSGYVWKPKLLSVRSGVLRTNLPLHDSDQDSFDSFLSEGNKVWLSKDETDKPKEISNSETTNQQDSNTEEKYMKYPFADKGLPLLSDHNNYWSGKYKNNFWHQNSDQVFVFYPIEDTVDFKDIKVNFQANQVDVYIKGELYSHFLCTNRIIPDGSFWTFEKDDDGNRYLHLDLEKRYRMINWKALFTAKIETKEEEEIEKAKLLQKIYAANQGLSKVTGKPAQTMSEMIADERLTSKLVSSVNNSQIITIQAPDGTQLFNSGELEEVDMALFGGKMNKLMFANGTIIDANDEKYQKPGEDGNINFSADSDEENDGDNDEDDDDDIPEEYLKFDTEEEYQKLLDIKIEDRLKKIAAGFNIDLDQEDEDDAELEEELKEILQNLEKAPRDGNNHESNHESNNDQEPNVSDVIDVETEN